MANKKYGGEIGIREQGTFEMLCEAPYQTMFGEELYPTVFDKAAKFIEGFCTHQVFFDGNKRTGVGAMNAFLKINGYESTLLNIDMYHLALDIANHKYELEEISNILSQNTRTTGKQYDTMDKILEEEKANYESR